MAIATESGYGAFLPQYENEFVNREALRGQMTKQASYLTEMDSVYAQLDERAREFDIGQASTEKWNEANLAQRASEFDRNLELNWAQQATNSFSAHASATNQATQLSQQQNQYDQNRIDQQNAASQYNNAMSNVMSGGNAGGYSSNDYADIWSNVAGTSSSGTVYNQYGQVVQGAGNYNYGGSSDSIGGFSSYGGGSGAVEGQTYSLGSLGVGGDTYESDPWGY